MESLLKLIFAACLKVESPIGIPDTFDLVLYNAPSAVAA
jgi:hypothetical protein